jgi:GR25 family glycosyltransferase involved in LPS biosynthesis
MIPWICITQDDEPWKLPRTLAHLAEHDIKPMVIHGINGHLAGLRPVNPHDILPDGTYNYMHPSQVGCVLSHIMALTIALAQGSDTFIIVEDDVVLHDNFESRLDEVLHVVPMDVGILQLDHNGASGRFASMPCSFGRVCECNNVFGSACIWWNSEAARRALLMLRPIDSSYDIMLIRKVYPFTKHYIVDPPLARQRTGAAEWPSSIGPTPKEIAC